MVAAPTAGPTGGRGDTRVDSAPLRSPLPDREDLAREHGRTYRRRARDCPGPPQSRLGSRVVGPQDPGWDEARRAWNLAVDQRPAAVAMPESPEDVVAVIEVAREHGFRVAPQGTGHSAAPRASLERSVLVDMSGMNAVEIDPDRRRARLQAGAQWQHVIGPAAEHGLAGLSGSAPDVCVTGYALGAARAGWSAVMAWPPTASGPPRSLPRTAARSEPTPPVSPSSSGRCAVAAAASAS